MRKAGYAERMTETRIQAKFWSGNLNSSDTVRRRKARQY